MAGRPRTYSSSTAGSGPFCIICFERERDANLSCGHKNLCAHCLARLARGADAPRCPTCRELLELTQYARRPGLQPVRFKPTGLPPLPPPRRPRSRQSLSPSASLRGGLDGAMHGLPAVSRRHSIGAPQATTAGRTVLVLGARGVAVSVLAQRLRSLNVSRPGRGSIGRRAISELGAFAFGAPSDVSYMWVAAAPTVTNDAVVERVHAIGPAAVILAFDVTQVASFEALLRWDDALGERFGQRAPRVWAALNNPNKRRGISMHDVRDALHCLGDQARVVVEIELTEKVFRVDQGARKLADAVARYLSPSRSVSIDGTPNDGMPLPRSPPPRSRPRGAPIAGAAWALVRQCL